MILDGDVDVYCKHCKVKIRRGDCNEMNEIHYVAIDIPIMRRHPSTGKIGIKYPLIHSSVWTFLSCPKCGNKLSDDPDSKLVECFASVWEEELMMIIKSKFLKNIESFFLKNMENGMITELRKYIYP